MARRLAAGSSPCRLSRSAAAGTAGHGASSRPAAAAAPGGGTRAGGVQHVAPTSGGHAGRPGLGDPAVPGVSPAPSRAKAAPPTGVTEQQPVTDVQRQRLAQGETGDQPAQRAQVPGGPG